MIQSDEMTVAQIRQRFRWSLDDFRRARLLGFPPALYRETRARTVEPVWRRDVVDAWAASVRALHLERD